MADEKRGEFSHASGAGHVGRLLLLLVQYGSIRHQRPLDLATVYSAGALLQVDCSRRARSACRAVVLLVTNFAFQWLTSAAWTTSSPIGDLPGFR